MNIGYAILVAALIFFSKLTYALDISPLITIRGGGDFAAVGSNNHVYYSALREPTFFQVPEKWQTKFVWGGFLGLEIPLVDNQNFLWQMGVAYYQTSPFNVEGTRSPNNTEWIADVGFHYSVLNRRVMFENKFLGVLNRHFALYALIGLGAAFNDAYGYGQTIIDPDAVTDKPAYFFADHSTTSFSYSLGLGIEIKLSENLRSSLGYQYSDLGKIELGKMPSATATDDTLKSPSTPTNEFLLSLSYFFY